MKTVHTLSEYACLVFDCDGVILDSNQVKTKAFYKVGLSYGESSARKLVEYHVANGGVSRYQKFKYFLDEVVGPEYAGSNLDELLVDFSREVREGLLTCGVLDILADLRKQNPNQRWLIVSGGDQAELRMVFEKRGIAKFFDGGIFGSPDEKKCILREQRNLGNIPEPAIYLGDSKYDYEAASEIGLEFVFVSAWTEVKDWKQFVIANSIPFVTSSSDLI